MQDEQLIEALNGLLSQEHACAIRYATHAAVVTGPYADIVQARLEEIASDEVSHAKKLRDRILAVGGLPTMDVNREDLKSAGTLRQILSINIGEEKEAIRRYTDLLKSIPPGNAILFRTIQAILSDEQEHLERLEALMEPKKEHFIPERKNEQEAIRRGREGMDAEGPSPRKDNGQGQDRPGTE